MKSQLDFRKNQCLNCLVLFVSISVRMKNYSKLHFRQFLDNKLQHITKFKEIHFKKITKIMEQNIMTLRLILLTQMSEINWI